MNWFMKLFAGRGGRTPDKEPAFRLELEDQQRFERELEAIEEKAQHAMCLDYEKEPSVVTIPRRRASVDEIEQILSENRKKLHERSVRAQEQADRALRINQKNYSWLSGKPPP